MIFTLVAARSVAGYTDIIRASTGATHRNLNLFKNYLLVPCNNMGWIWIQRDAARPSVYHHREQCKYCQTKKRGEPKPPSDKTSSLPELVAQNLNAIRQPGGQVAAVAVTRTGLHDQRQVAHGQVARTNVADE